MTGKIVLLFTIVAVSSLVECRPTHCELWKGDSQFRCAKDDYHADSVKVRNRAGGNVAFKVGKWMSRCGGPNGMNYDDKAYTLYVGGSVDMDFSRAGPGTCNEMFVYDCTINNRAVNCLTAVFVEPNL